MRPAVQSIKKEKPQVLRHDLRKTNEPGILLRRAIVGSSLVGIACMAITTLFQTGMVKHLADPPIEGFDSDKVNASDLAYSWGMPDSPLLPLAATVAALPAAVTAARYLFHDMPVREKGWCPYCIVDALAHLAVLGFTLWESKQAIDRLRRG